MRNITKPLINVIIGFILIILSIVWYFVRIPVISDFISYYMTGPVTFIPFWKIPILLIVGLFGMCIFFAGLILVWIGWDDYKMEKELAEEEAEGTENEELEAEEDELEKGPMTEISEEKTEFVCDVCGKKVKNKAGLVAHKRIHK